MSDFKSIDYEKFLIKLRETCRHQLIRYPELSKVTFKDKVKGLLKKASKGSIRTDRFFWPNGLLAIALEQTYKAKNEIEDRKSLIKYYDKWIDTGIKINHLDNVINGYSMVFVYEITNDDKYKIALEKIARYIIDHPKDKYNSLPYRITKSQPDKLGYIFVDSLGMICPFLCRYGELKNDKIMVDLAITQLKNYIKYGVDVTRKLPYHAYSAENKVKFGIIGWGRAVGWMLMGLVDSLEYIDKGHKEYDFLSKNFTEIVDATVEYQRSDGHFSWQLEALEGPYDSSSTSMIGYAIGKAIKIGILDNYYQKYVEKAIIALYNSTNDGYVKDCSAECLGLSMYPQKYGWYPWSQGPTTALVSMFYDGVE